MNYSNYFGQVATNNPKMLKQRLVMAYLCSNKFFELKIKEVIVIA